MKKQNGRNKLRRAQRMLKRGHAVAVVTATTGVKQNELVSKHGNGRDNKQAK